MSTKKSTKAKQSDPVKQAETTAAEANQRLTDLRADLETTTARIRELESRPIEDVVGDSGDAAVATQAVLATDEELHTLRRRYEASKAAIPAAETHSRIAKAKLTDAVCEAKKDEFRELLLSYVRGQVASFVACREIGRHVRTIPGRPTGAHSNWLGLFNIQSIPHVVKFFTPTHVEQVARRCRADWKERFPEFAAEIEAAFADWDAD